MICNTCKQDKSLQAFQKVKYTLTPRNSPPYEGFYYKKRCRECRKRIYWDAGKHISRNEYNKVRREKWGYVCEVYVNNPDYPLEKIGAIFGLNIGQVSRIISEYIGNGSPVYMNISVE